MIILFPVKISKINLIWIKHNTSTNSFYTILCLFQREIHTKHKKKISRTYKIC